MTLKYQEGRILSCPHDEMDQNTLDPLAKWWREVEQSSRWWPIGCRESPCGIMTLDFRKTNKITLTSASVALAEVVIPPSDVDSNDVRHISGRLKLRYNTQYRCCSSCLTFESIFFLFRVFIHLFFNSKSRSYFTHEISVSILTQITMTELDLKLTKAKHWACIRINSRKNPIFRNLYTQSSSLNHHVYFSQHYEAPSLLSKDPFNQHPQILLGMFPVGCSGCRARASWALLICWKQFTWLKLKHWSTVTDLQGIFSLSLT